MVCGDRSGALCGLLPEVPSSWRIITRWWPRPWLKPPPVWLGLLFHRDRVMSLGTAPLRLVLQDAGAAGLAPSTWVSKDVANHLVA